jgi:SAM-dependent methyltransferase
MSGLRSLFDQVARTSRDGLGDVKATFAASRFDEGERAVEFLRRLFPALLTDRPTIVDLGSGNGGMLFPFATLGRCIAVDTYVDPDLRRFVRLSRLGVHQLRAVAQSLPLASESVDVVILAEVIEHLTRPSVAGAEIMRILKPGGVCLISTPPRLVFARRPDPHFQIPFLVALPDFLQRVVARRLRPGVPYNVTHIYGTTWGIARQFPRGSFKMHVISHRANWARHLSWNYLVLRKEEPY